MNDLFLRNLSLSIFGGSHDPQIGVKLGGLPAGESIDMEELQRFLARRAPGSSAFGTRRKEPDAPEFLSGISAGKTDGGVLHAIIRNVNQHSGDYPARPDIPRPSHADYAAIVKYGDQVDLRGGGHFSGRLTAPLCIAGGIARQILFRRGIRIGAHIAQIGPIRDACFDPVSVSDEDFAAVLANDFPTLDPSAGSEMCRCIEAVRMEQDSIGGVVECAVIGLPVGLGEHMFDGMENRISAAVFAVPAVKGIEFGNGFECAALCGSQNNDAFVTDGKKITTRTNNCGGILGGMTDGMPLVFRAAMKPTPSIYKEQDSVDMVSMKPVRLRIHGRHDPCVAVRAVPAIEAVTAIAVYDAIIDSKQSSEVN